MPMSDHLRELRAKLGHALLVLPSATAVVRDEYGRLLLARHADDGRWGLPGGCVDPRESPSDAVVRETFEETGILVEPLRIVGVYGGADFHVRYPNGDEVCYVATVFECRAASTARPRADGLEILEVAHFTPGELERLELPARVRRILGDLEFRRAAFPSVTWRPTGVDR